MSLLWEQMPGPACSREEGTKPILGSVVSTVKEVQDLLPCFSVLGSPSQKGENSPQLPLAHSRAGAPWRRVSPAAEAGGSVAPSVVKSPALLGS